MNVDDLRQSLEDQKLCGSESQVPENVLEAARTLAFSLLTSLNSISVARIGDTVHVTLTMPSPGRASRSPIACPDLVQREKIFIPTPVIVEEKPVKEARFTERPRSRKLWEK